jgi:hypothetical protein
VRQSRFGSLLKCLDGLNFKFGHTMTKRMSLDKEGRLLHWHEGCLEMHFSKNIRYKYSKLNF